MILTQFIRGADVSMVYFTLTFTLVKVKVSRKLVGESVKQANFRAPNNLTYRLDNRMSILCIASWVSTIIVSYNRRIHTSKVYILVCSSTNYMKSDKKWFHQNYKPTQYNLHTESMQKLSLVLTYMLFEFQSRVEIQKSTWRNIKGPRWPNGQRLQYILSCRGLFLLCVCPRVYLFLLLHEYTQQGQDRYYPYTNTSL